LSEVFYRLSKEHEEALLEFFLVLQRTGATRLFHPHKFDVAEAHERCKYIGQDEYHVAIDDGVICAYGMLRGWDAGYAIPSLGLAVHPQKASRGLGRRVFQHLHAVARARGATQVRVKVYRENTRSMALCRSLGYEFRVQEGDHQLVGIIDL
jgi:GNAT superfamily N-acetyltransferase